MNKVILSGLVGKCEIKPLNSGGVFAKISVATKDFYKDENNELQEITDWHNISLYGKLAEKAQDKFKVGALVELEGKLKTRKWQDQNGNNRWKTEIVIKGYGTTMKLLRHPSGYQQSNQQDYQSGQQGNQQENQQENKQFYQGGQQGNQQENQQFYQSGQQGSQQGNHGGQEIYQDESDNLVPF